MEIEKSKLLELIEWFLSRLDATEAELLAHTVVFQGLSVTGQFPELNGLLDLARENPSPVHLKRQAERREAMTKEIEKGNADHLFRILRNSTPSGPVN